MATAGFWTKHNSSTRLNRETRLRVESLESRTLLTVNLTDYEQLVLELVNRARMDPLAEVAINNDVSDLNQGLTAGTITSTPKQPLASVQELVDAGRTHALDMLARDYFSHYTMGTGESPTDRAATAGYSGPVGENIAWNGTTGTLNQNSATARAHDALFTSPPHRQNLMRDSYDHAGMSVEFGQYTSGQTYNAVMVVQTFGYSSGNPYLTGVAFSDSVIADDFYSIGESESGITIQADDGNGTIYSTVTGSSGSYNIKLPAGTYTVTASGGSLANAMTASVTVGSQNVKLDFNTSEAPESPPTHFDLVGFNTGEEFWVGTSNGSTLDTAYWGDWSSATAYEQILMGDFNGDGYDDMAGRNSAGDLIVGISTETGNGRSFVSSTWGNLTNITDWTVLVGDFNGDGMDDLLGRAAIDGTFWLAESNGSGFSNAYWGRLMNTITWSDMLVGDFNGDGRDDTVARAPDGTWWGSISDGTGLTNSFWGRWRSNVQWHDVVVGDFNGDGMDDIAGRGSNKNWWVNRSVGGYFVIEWWTNWTATVEWLDVSVGDYDGDGRDDIAGRANGQWWIAMSNGTGFSNSYWGYWTTTVDWHDVKKIDINGDDQDDVIGRAGNGQWWVFQSDGQSFSGRLAAQWSPGATWQFVGIGNFV